MPAAGRQKTRLTRGDDRGAEVVTRHGPPGTFRDALGDAGDAGGAVEPLAQAACDDADDAGMPALAGDQKDRAAGIGLGLALAQSRIEDVGLDGLALAVDGVEGLGHRARFVGVVAQQQAQTQIGLPDPAGGVDAGAERETQRHRIRRAVHGGDIQQRGNPRPLATRHHPQALRHEGAVEAGERHDVADGRQRDEVEQRHQVRLGSRGEPLRAAQRPDGGDHGEERHAGRAQAAQARAAVEAVRVDGGQDGRDAVGLVVVEHDHVRAVRSRPARRRRRCRNRRR